MSYKRKNHNTAWSEQDDLLLKEHNESNTPLEKTARTLGRTANAISFRRSILGLKMSVSTSATTAPKKKYTKKIVGYRSTENVLANTLALVKTYGLKATLEIAGKSITKIVIE